MHCVPRALFLLPPMRAVVLRQLHAGRVRPQVGCFRLVPMLAVVPRQLHAGRVRPGPDLYFTGKERNGIVWAGLPLARVKP